MAHHANPDKLRLPDPTLMLVRQQPPQVFFQALKATVETNVGANVPNNNWFRHLTPPIVIPLFSTPWGCSLSR